MRNRKTNHDGSPSINEIEIVGVVVEDDVIVVLCTFARRWLFLRRVDLLSNGLLSLPALFLDIFFISLMDFCLLLLSQMAFYPRMG